MDVVLTAWVVVLGLVIGSFLNVVIFRLPRKMMFRSDRSICPTCERQLAWYHNIPVLSFILLRGKCAFCASPISWRYPLVESLNSLAYLYFFHFYSWSWPFATWAVLSSLLIIVIFIDYDFQIIPDVITIPGMILGLVAALLPGGMGIVASAIGLVVGGGALYLIAVFGDWLFKKESMGGGDIKLAAMLGSFLGWSKMVVVLMSAAFIGLFVSLLVMVFSARLRQTRLIPFGPFLAVAAFVALLYGDQLINLYLTRVVGLAMP
jgi:leader peptidase (prepilin peptidase)/N-methyltransferase